jgi:hypothetical protein
MRATTQYTFANHCRTHLCCVDQCACFLAFGSRHRCPGPFCRGFCATAGRSTLTTVLQSHELRRVSPIRVSNNSLFPILPFYISDLHWEEAFFSCISSSPPERLPISRPLTGITFRPRVITLTLRYLACGPPAQPATIETGQAHILTLVIRSFA